MTGDPTADASVKRVQHLTAKIDARSARRARSDRRKAWGSWIASLLLVVSVFMTGWILVQARANERDSAINSCRAEYAADVQVASVRDIAAVAAQVSLFPETIRQAMTDLTQLDQVLARAQELDDSVQARGADAEAAAARYKAAARLASTDPEKFLDECQARR